MINHTDTIDWVPLSAGTSFKPITFFPGDTGYQLLLRVEPGTVVPRHRHTGEVHAFVLSGQRRIHGGNGIIRAGSYVYEPVGNIDSWEAVGNEPCVVHIEVDGRVEYLNPDDTVHHQTDATTARAAYVAWCDQHNLQPDTQLALVACHEQ